MHGTVQTFEHAELLGRKQIVRIRSANLLDRERLGLPDVVRHVQFDVADLLVELAAAEDLLI